MCGFTSVIDHTGISLERLRKQTDALERRGPDHGGQWVSPDGVLGLGSRRLAILDLSPQGQMPMLSACGRVALSFNGEVYNHVALRAELRQMGHAFVSNTDTEVVLQGFLQWGTEVVKRLEGMFAFALFDQRSDPAQLILARDRVGEKPLLIFQQGQRLIAASELSAILADERVPREISPEGLDSLLQLGYLGQHHSLLRGVRKLLPGRIARVNTRTLEIHEETYWHPPEPMQHQAALGPELIDQFFGQLKQAVARQLVADVPVGLFLSGGLDSGLVAAAMADIGVRNVDAFTIGFGGVKQFDETQQAASIARHFGIKHHILDFTGEMREEFAFIASRLDEPIGDASILPTSLVCRFAKGHVKVCLGGDGGDELFGGYPHYQQRNEAGVTGLIRQLASPLEAIGQRLPLGVSGKAQLSAIGGSAFDRTNRRRQVFWPRERHQLLNPELLNARRNGDGRPSAKLPWRHPDLRDRLMAYDFQNYLPNDILTKVDRASMLHSLEVRAPMLDAQVVDFAYAEVPTEAKVTPTEGKRLLRSAAQRYLPPSSVQQRKQGFSIPGALFSDPKWQGDAIEAIEALPSAWFKKSSLDSLIKRARQSPSAGSYLFVLALISHWSRRFQIS
ncbi:MAG: asparagine synthase (glutamine-hydrolyzing) [Pseudomonadota bacterium]